MSKKTYEHHWFNFGGQQDRIIRTNGKFDNDRLAFDAAKRWEDQYPGTTIITYRVFKRYDLVRVEPK